MRRRYLNIQYVISQLMLGAEIFTDRGFGGAPYTPLFFKLYAGDNLIGEIHHQTIKKLIKDKIINSKDNESGSGKYKLRVN